MGTAVAGARPPDVLEDAAAPLAEEAPPLLLLPPVMVWCLPVMVALWAMAETVASSDLREDATLPTKQKVVR
jgi:hypothetical protein